MKKKNQKKKKTLNFYTLDLYLGSGNVEVELAGENTVSAKRFGVVSGRRRIVGGHGSGAKRPILLESKRKFRGRKVESRENS